MFSNCITPTASLFAYVMYSNIMPNIIISFRHGRFFSFAWCYPILLQMCINGFLSLSSVEILHRNSILVFTINSLFGGSMHFVMLCHLHLNNVISSLDRSKVLTVLLNFFFFFYACNFFKFSFNLFRSGSCTLKQTFKQIHFKVKVENVLVSIFQ